MAVNYGIDAPKTVRGLVLRGAAFLVGGPALYLVLLHRSPGVAGAFWQIGISGGLAQLAQAAFMLWSSKVGKFRVRDRVIGAMTWRGDEQVLDVGCGRGLALIAAAKQLGSGRATGVDIWSAVDLSANTAEATMENARAEGVADRVTLETGDARALPFPDRHFDVVVSMTALHNISGAADRRLALTEIVRVLKPGGVVSMFDIFHTGSYRKVLVELGMIEPVMSGPLLLWLVPGRRIVARKPS